MKHIFLKITGIPYGQSKTTGNTDAPKVWSKNVEEQTKDLPKIIEACVMNITFLLPPNKFPRDFPYGSDLDNLLKRFMDVMNNTVFSDAPGKDSCVVSMNVSKAKVEKEEESGVILELIPVSFK